MTISTKNLIALVVFLIWLSQPALSQETDIYHLDKTVVVTVDRLSSSFSEIARTVVVINKQEIEKAPVSCVEELLSYASGVDIRQRGAGGVQSDISIRGSSFQQVLIMVDGVKVNNPQTGHHNLNIPISLSEVERVEILKGPAARLFGPDAMHGVVNIITSSNAQSRLHLETTAGDFGYFDREVSLAYSGYSTGHRLSIDRRISTGYRNNTEFDITTFSYRGNFRKKQHALDFSAGYTKKEYGAHKFYSDLYPDEWEGIESRLFSVGYTYQKNSFNINPDIYWHHHDNDFILDRNRPDWYRNTHITDNFGIETQAGIESSWGITVIGFDLARQEIESSNLGIHHFSRGGLFLEQRLRPVYNIVFTPGFSVYRQTGLNWKIWPGLDIRYQLSKSTKVYFTYGTSYRTPTFTELYYRDPANIGNPDLEVETARAYEVGAGIDQQLLSANLSFFIHNDKNVIDWVRANTSDPWQAKNTAKFDSRGVELNLTGYPGNVWQASPVIAINTQYSYFDLERTSGEFESKYVLDNLKHQLILVIDQDWFSLAYQRWIIRCLKKFTGDDYLIVDTRLSRPIGKLSIFIEATNLFDVSYTEVGTIPVPGRWFKMGMRVDLFSN